MIKSSINIQIKQPTYIIFLEKKTLFWCERVKLSAGHLFKSKNNHSKKFEIFIFYSMFMSKTLRLWQEGWLEVTITFFEIEIEKNPLDLYFLEALSNTS